MRALFIFFISLFITTQSFGQSDQILTKEKPFSVEHQYSSDLATMKKIISGYKPYQAFFSYVKTDFEAYKLIYKSEVNRKPVTLSGSILIPKKYVDNKKPLLVFCHGTTFNQNVASNWNSPMHIEALSAMNNYITFLPDYLGYGLSKEEVPTYMDKKNTVKHIKDFIKYGMKALKELNIAHSNSINILGFSQGGHAAISLAEDQNKKKSKDFSLKKVVSIGGPTDLNENLEYILKQELFKNSGYVTYILGSYNHYYWRKKTSKFFKQPYDNLVEGFQERKITLKMLNDSTTSNIKELMKESFIKKYISKSSYKIRKEFTKNSIQPFKTSIPILIIHGKMDQDVPFSITKSFYKKLKKINKDEMIKFTPLENLDHNQSGLIGMKVALDYFNNM